MILELKPTVNPQLAVSEVRQLADRAQNFSGQIPGGPIDQVHKWQSLAHDALTVRSVSEFVYSARYFQVLALGSANPFAGSMHLQELTDQEAMLRTEVTELSQMIDVYRAGIGSILVPDTSALLRMKSFVGLPWAELVESSPARVVLPLRVVEELDRHKYGETEYRNTARKLLRSVEDLFQDSLQRIAPLGTTATVEILVVPGPRQHFDGGDQEILETARRLRQFTADSVTVVTLDTAMRAQARLTGLKALEPPASFLRAQELKLRMEANQDEGNGSLI